MTDKTAPASPLQALARHWWLAVALPLVLAVVGFVVGGMRATEYTAESRVAVGSGSLSAGAIAGFPTASQDLAANYARWVNNRGIDGDSDIKGADVSASPIPDSNVVRVEAKSSDQAQAIAAADKTAKDLVAAVNTKKGDSDPNVTLQQLNAIAAKYGQAKAAADAANTAASKAEGAGRSAAAISAAQSQAAKTASAAAVYQAQMDALSQKYQQQISQGSTAADLRVVAPADVSSSTKASNQQRGALVGLALGLLLALLAAMAMERGRRRRTPTRTTTRTTPVATDTVAGAHREERPETVDETARDRRP